MKVKKIFRYLRGELLSGKYLKGIQMAFNSLCQDVLDFASSFSKMQLTYDGDTVNIERKQLEGLALFCGIYLPQIDGVDAHKGFIRLSETHDDLTNPIIVDGKQTQVQGTTAYIEDSSGKISLIEHLDLQQRGAGSASLLYVGDSTTQQAGDTLKYFVDEQLQTAENQDIDIILKADKLNKASMIPHTDWVFNEKLQMNLPRGVDGFVPASQTEDITADGQPTESSITRLPPEGMAYTFHYTNQEIYLITSFLTKTNASFETKQLLQLIKAMQRCRFNNISFEILNEITMIMTTTLDENSSQEEWDNPDNTMIKLIDFNQIPNTPVYTLTYSYNESSKIPKRVERYTLWQQIMALKFYNVQLNEVLLGA